MMRQHGFGVVVYVLLESKTKLKPINQSISHPFSFHNSALALAGEKHYQTIIITTVNWGNFGRWGNFGQYITFILSNIFCHLKNNLVVNMEVKGYLQSVVCFKRSFIRLDPMMS